MVLPNLAFDALLFGLLLIAAGLDSAFPFLHGVASLLIVGGTTYWAAQELSDWLLRRFGWTQESLATALALCIGGLFYFWFRNTSDFALLFLSLGLMMGSLMVAISIMSAFSSTFKEGRVTPLVGWIVTGFTSSFLGIAAGVLAITLGVEGTATLPMKVGGLLVAFIVWKLHEKFAGLETNPHFVNPTTPAGSPAPSPLHPHRVALFPQRGRLIDRFIPLLLVGAVLMLIMQGRVPGALHLESPAVASPDTTDSGEANS